MVVLLRIYEDTDIHYFQNYLINIYYLLNNIIWSITIKSYLKCLSVKYLYICKICQNVSLLNKSWGGGGELHLNTEINIIL